MLKKQKKSSSKGQTKFSKKYILFFVIFIAVLCLTLLQVQNRQTYQQQAQTATCGAPGDTGNSLGVGKYCTQGGGQCQGLQASICSADIQLNGSGICSKSCNTDADCGTGAVCYQDTLGKGCEPIVCQSSPTPSQNPSPTSVCLGSCVTPTGTQTPTISVQPTQTPTTTPPANTGGGGNLLQLLLQLLLQIIQFFANLFK